MLKNLGGVPDKYNLQRVACGVWWGDYQRELVPELQANLSHPFILAAIGCMARAIHCISDLDKIQFIFGEQKLSDDNLIALDRIVFRQLKLNQRVSLTAIMAYENTVCLDPADYLAFEVREYKSFKGSEKANICLPILGDGSAVGCIFSRDRLKSINDYFTKHGMAVESPPREKMIDLLIHPDPIDPALFGAGSLRFNIFS